MSLLYLHITYLKGNYVKWNCSLLSQKLFIVSIFSFSQTNFSSSPKIESKLKVKFEKFTSANSHLELMIRFILLCEWEAEANRNDDPLSTAQRTSPKSMQWKVPFFINSNEKSEIHLNLLDEITKDVFRFNKKKV